jgi:hypothetical protein
VAVLKTSGADRRPVNATTRSRFAADYVMFNGDVVVSTVTRKQPFLVSYVRLRDKLSKTLSGYVNKIVRLLAFTQAPAGFCRPRAHV